MMTKKNDARAEGEAWSERATLDKETTLSLLSSGSSKKKPPETGDPKNSTARSKRGGGVPWHEPLHNSKGVNHRVSRSRKGGRLWVRIFFMSCVKIHMKQCR